MSQHRKSAGAKPSRIGIAAAWAGSLVAAVGTWYILNGGTVDDMRHVAGWMFGMFSTATMVIHALVLGEQRRVAQIREVREARRREIDARTSGGPGSGLPQRDPGAALRVIGVPVFRTEAERAGWADAPTEVIRTD
jgi:hypothetical protein